jgi:hypothetical protein
MDPLTIAIVLLTAVVAVLAVLIWLGHLDTSKILGRMDRAIERMDRSATAAEHAADGAREAAVAAREAATAANLSANACLAMAKEVGLLVQQIVRDRPQPGPAE